MRLSTIILLLIRFKIGNDKKKDFKIRITHNCLFFTDLYWSHNRSKRPEAQGPRGSIAKCAVFRAN